MSIPVTLRIRHPQAKVLEQLGGVRVSRAKAPFLHNKVERLAARAGIKRPLVYVIQDDAPNACAVGLSEDDTAVAVTTGLLKHLDENEIEAVLAHEVGHIQKGHSVAKTAVAAKAMGLNLAVELGGQVILLSDIDLTPDDDDADDSGSMLIKILVATVAQAAAAALAAKMLTAVSFDAEFEADESGAQLSRRPWALVRALSKLERLAMQGKSTYEKEISQLFIVPPEHFDHSTHPPTVERIGRLAAMSAQLPAVADTPTVFCSSCGEKTDADGKFCYWCGGELDTAGG